MRKEIRRGTFETNSSSTHSLAICTEEEFENWEAGKVLFDEWGQRFILPYQLSDDEKKRAASEYTKNKKEFYKDWEELSDVQKEKWYSKYIEDHNLGNNEGVTYNQFFANDYLKTFCEGYTTPKGDKIVCFGKYGYDG